VDPEDLEGTIHKAAQIILNDGVVVFPTQAFYGLGANSFSFRAVEKVYRIKQRALSKPILREGLSDKTEGSLKTDSDLNCRPDGTLSFGSNGSGFCHRLD
jgi:L-threonylcarbamoyladenylate synthase